MTSLCGLGLHMEFSLPSPSLCISAPSIRSAPVSLTLRSSSLSGQYQCAVDQSVTGCIYGRSEVVWLKSIELPCAICAELQFKSVRIKGLQFGSQTLAFLFADDISRTVGCAADRAFSLQS